MARFEHLEFGPDANDRARPEQPEKQQPEEDEQRALANADDCRRRGQYESALRFYSRALEYDKSLSPLGSARCKCWCNSAKRPRPNCGPAKPWRCFPATASCWPPRRRRCAGRATPGRPARCATRRWGRPADRPIAGRCGANGCWPAVRSWKNIASPRRRRSTAIGWSPLESALIYLHYNFPSRAVARARLATELAPAEYHPWFVRGTAEAALGLRQSASESFDQCLQLCPRHVEAMARRRELSAGWSAGTVWKACRNFLRRR